MATNMSLDFGPNEESDIIEPVPATRFQNTIPVSAGGCRGINMLDFEKCFSDFQENA